MQGMCRVERDSMGEVCVPADAYWGAQTQRAVENFPISGVRFPRAFIRAMGLVKKAAAVANGELGAIPPHIADAIVKGAERVIAGELDRHFVVDVYQAGAGTSSHMNANEVIANAATELLGGRRGAYIVHPNDHVNYGQSTNDVFPTVMRLSALAESVALEDALAALADALDRNAAEFESVVKAGRTHLKDAAPLTLGQEFSGYAAAIRKSRGRIAEARGELAELGIGGSAVGTGLNTKPGFRERVVVLLRDFTGLPLRPAPNLFEAMQSQSPIVSLSSALRSLALELTRIANDLRLLSSGPNTGLAEIVLPPVQPGSSIMPGKVNPSMAEMLNMVCFAVVGNDTTIALAEQAGQLELNVMMPVMCYKLLDSITIQTSAIRAFTERCVVGIAADEARCRSYFERTVAVVTALSPYIGYDKAAEIAKESVKTGRSVRELAEASGMVAPDILAKVFSRENLIP